ncbi:hypothetical protein ACG02S_18210, partial [Roseateles sp. DC23W]
ASQSSAKRRDFDLLSQRRQVLLKNNFSKHSTSSPARPNLSVRLANHVCVFQLSAVISEAHDCSTANPELARSSAKNFQPLLVKVGCTS